MSSSLAREVLSALSEFSSHTRLYELKFKDERKGASLLVDAFAADEQLLGVGGIDVIALSTRSKIAQASLLGQETCLEISLANGTRASFSGFVSKIASLGSDGGLARYRLRLSPWIWLLSQARSSRAWQDKTVIEIIDSVFEQYQPYAQWVWSGDVNLFMSDAVARSYCCQYRESDLDFVTRLLTEEGLGWRFEEHDDGSRMVLFADSSQLSAAPDDVSSEAGGGIRYHAASAVENSDSIQYLQAFRKLGVAVVKVLSYDYKAKQTVSVSVSTKYPIGGKNAQAVESFDAPGQYAYADARQARRYAGLKMEAYEARGFIWQGRSTVRTLRPGTRICITDIPMKKYRYDAPEFVLTRVASVGVNNLPVTAKNGLTELFGALPELLEESIKGIPLAEFDRAVEQAQKSGYANCFEAIPLERPWRPKMELRVAPTANGSQTAIVVGPDGSDEPNGADEIYCDRLGRVRIRFHWQESDAACWVRVGQRSAGAGMGSQFLPRIGQEVLVKFIEGDIDRPVIVGALYNGRGEGGVMPTPRGVSDRESSSAAFERAHDQMPSGQVNLAGGNSPVWHGASAGSAGHRNNSAQWGVRSKEFGGRGYNQLLFDDTDGQGRIQLKTTHAATELNLGHLIHTADNYRGSIRGSGAELRTDAYGALRAGAGLLISSYKISHSSAVREAAGENASGNALLKQAIKLAESFSAAAKTHETVGLAGHLGATKAGTSAIDDEAAPLKALWTASAGMLSKNSIDEARSDAGSKNVDAGAGKVPHAGAPMIGIAAKAGLGVVAGQDVQLSTGETVTIASGADTEFTAGGQMRVHSGQAIGVLAGAVKAGEGDVGLQLIAGKGAIDYQAQADELKVQARDDINVISANAHMDWAAAKSISLSTAGGANITIDGGNITVQCPGKITVHAGMKKFGNQTKFNYSMPLLPKSICVECLLVAVKSGIPFAIPK
ncbi:type VI secretion system tip protein VgrG [Massilia eurypsychrophila]|uniref:Type VI secretion system tip protein VgrG n=3 Tax=Massilia eurypsychrophila TaxID=1485217 RepID=A0A2G8T9E4_9BURK|nr:type VI secretion system Vgr family protein [Massilia eurypsychrophila]PIL42593.1 type VI secretion system tip protein VgrG [Massilia eurypsychrophila]